MKIGIELNHIVRDVNSQMLKYFKKDIDIVKEFNCYNCVRSRGPGYPSLDKKCLKCTSNNHYRNLPAGERDFYERRIYNEERFVETFR